MLFLNWIRAANVNDLARVKPTYVTMPGWRSDISKARRFDELPKQAQDYIRLIEKHLSVPGKCPSWFAGSLCERHLITFDC